MIAIIASPLLPDRCTAARRRVGRLLLLRLVLLEALADALGELEKLLRARVDALGLAAVEVFAVVRIDARPVVGWQRAMAAMSVPGYVSKSLCKRRASMVEKCCEKS